MSSDQLAREIRHTRLVTDVHWIVVLLVVETLLLAAGWIAGWIAVDTSASTTWRLILAVIVFASLAVPAVWSVLYSRIVVTIIPGGTHDQ